MALPTINWSAGRSGLGKPELQPFATQALKHTVGALICFMLQNTASRDFVPQKEQKYQWQEADNG